ncbi:MAG: hypothetical protein ACTSXP_18895, partial [Promethearchaeota archaeon]
SFHFFYYAFSKLIKKPLFKGIYLSICFVLNPDSELLSFKPRITLDFLNTERLPIQDTGIFPARE